MIHKLIAATVLSLGVAASSHAGTYWFTTNALTNSTTDGVGASATGGPLTLTAGQVFTVNTDPGQIWHAASPGDEYYAYFTSNADGVAGSSMSLAGLAPGAVRIGALVADINGDYRVLGAGSASFAAWGSGELHLHFADINAGDNIGSVVSSVTAVPEPSSYAMLLGGMGLIGLARRRRRKS